MTFVFLLIYRVVALDMRGYGESDKPSGVENYVIDILDNDLKVFAISFCQGPLTALKFVNSMLRNSIK